MIGVHSPYQARGYSECREHFLPLGTRRAEAPAPIRVRQGRPFREDTVTAAALTRTELEDLVTDPADRLTFMCAPWGSGERIGIDRDLDGILNQDEI